MKTTSLIDNSLSKLSASQVNKIKEFTKTDAFFALKSLYEARQSKLEESAIEKTMPLHPPNPHLDYYNSGHRAGIYKANKFFLALEDIIEQEVKRRQKKEKKD